MEEWTGETVLYERVRSLPQLARPSHIWSTTTHAEVWTPLKQVTVIQWVLWSINERSTNGTDYMVKMTLLQSLGGTREKEKEASACQTKRAVIVYLFSLSLCLSFHWNRCLSLAPYRFHLVCSAGDMRFMGRPWRRKRRWRRMEKATSESAWLRAELFTHQTETFTAWH